MLRSLVRQAKSNSKTTPASALQSSATVGATTSSQELFMRINPWSAATLSIWKLSPIATAPAVTQFRYILLTGTKVVLVAVFRMRPSMVTLEEVLGVWNTHWYAPNESHKRYNARGRMNTCLTFSRQECSVWLIILFTDFKG